MKNKTLNIILNIVVALILVVVLIVSVLAIMSGDKGYVDLFGTTYLSAASDSMEGDREDNFNEDDLLKIKILSDEEKSQLIVGDVIAFYDTTIVPGKTVINTHRIIEIKLDNDGNRGYITRGDNTEGQDKTIKFDGAVVGLYDGKIANVGKITAFFNTGIGFFICIVLPSFLIVGYFAFNLYKTVKIAKHGTAEQQAAAREQEIVTKLAEQEESMRKKIMEELKNEQSSSDKDEK